MNQADTETVVFVHHPESERDDLMVAGLTDTSATLIEAVPKIHIRFFGAIRAVIEKSDDELDYSPDTTVSGLLCLLSDKYGKALRDELFDGIGSNLLREDLMITVNETIINREKATGTIIKPGDTIALYPTFPGGG